MAVCDEGYICDVCGKEVEAITDSALYLQYVLGAISPNDLPNTQERHIRCDTTLAQFIVAPAFAPVICEGPFAKTHLDPAYVLQQERLITRAWERLQEIPQLGIAIPEYPLPEVLRSWDEQNRSERRSEQATK
ncbi:MAG: hypothetical protein ACFCD0_21020 [Gemmataceae bacterium]